MIPKTTREHIGRADFHLIPDYDLLGRGCRGTPTIHFRLKNPILTHKYWFKTKVVFNKSVLELNLQSKSVLLLYFDEFEFFSKNSEH